jgi:hypothetical protein
MGDEGDASAAGGVVARSGGRPLPTLPLWLREDAVIALDLEQSYEQACSDLWIS